MILIEDPNKKNENETFNEKLKRKTRKLSIFEGCFGGLSGNLSDNYMTPFALSINANALHIGILSSLGALFSPIGQILGANSIEKYSRKKTLLTGTLGQSLLWLFFILVAKGYGSNIIPAILIWFLIFLYLLYTLMGGIMTPPWFSMMGDIVDENFRGRYFAKRNLITLIVILSGSISISFMLDWYKIQDLLIPGFILIFIIGFISRIISFLFFTQHYYPPLKIETEDHFGMIQFFKELPKSNIGKFTLFVALITFGQWIAGPFFAVYMLETLHFSYSTYIFITLFSSIVSLFIFPILGKFSDKFGNLKLIRFGAIIIPFLPILWIFFDTPLQILLMPQLLSGIAWTAFNLAASNFIYDNLPRQKRALFIAYYNFLIGIGIIMGGLIGGLLVIFLPVILINNFFFVFIIMMADTTIFNICVFIMFIMVKNSLGPHSVCKCRVLNISNIFL